MERQIKTQEQVKLKDLQEQLNAAFKEQGIYELYDKRNIMRNVLDHDEILKGLKATHYYRLIEYIENLSTNEYNAVAWLCSVNKEAGLNKVHLRKLMNMIPSTVNVHMVQLEHEEEGLQNVYGYVEYDFYQTYREEIHSILKTAVWEVTNSNEPIFYKLNNRLHLSPIQEQNTAVTTADSPYTENARA